MVQINLKNEIDFCTTCPQTSSFKYRVVMTELNSGKFTATCSGCGYTKIVEKDFVRNLFDNKFKEKLKGYGISNFNFLYNGDWDGL